MIPTAQILTEPIEDIIYPTETYKILTDENRIKGHTNDLDAVIQTIYLILNTERYKYIIYSWDYGVELVDLFGKPMPFVISEVERRIREALLQDDRITAVTNFEFEKSGKNLNVKFEVLTDAGKIQVEKEVAVS